jgi:hypothetical protein
MSLHAMKNREWAAMPRWARDEICEYLASAAPPVIFAAVEQSILKPATEQEFHVVLARMAEGLGNIAMKRKFSWTRPGSFPPLFLGITHESALRGDVDLLFHVPVYAHDCDECSYLGRIAEKACLDDDDFPAVQDAYLCNKAGYSSIVIRHGDNGPDYESMPEQFVGQGSHPRFQAALGRLRMIRYRRWH